MAKKDAPTIKSSPGPNFGSLQQIFDDVWWVWGTVRFAPGMYFPRNMVVVREKGELVIVHGVMMPEAEQKKLEALGPIKHYIRLGNFHGMDDLRYFERYSPTVWMPPDVEVRPGVTVHHQLRPGAPTPIEGATLFSFERSHYPELALHIPRHGGLVLTCDSIQNWEKTTGCSFFAGLMAPFMGFKGRACIGPAWKKYCEPKDGRGLAPDFERLLEFDFRHLIGAHGAPMKDDAKEALQRTVSRVFPS
jgi:hypothetical protein